MKLTATSFRALTLVGLLVLAGCSAAQPQTEDEEKISIADYSDVTVKLDLTNYQMKFPLDEYTVSSIDQVRIAWVGTIAIGECMVAKGLTYPASAIDWQKIIPGENRLFGFWSIPYAEKFGSNYPPEAEWKQKVLAAEEEVSKTPDWVSSNMACSEEIAKTNPSIKAFTDWEPSRRLIDINSDSYDLASEEADWKKANSDWADCVAEQGLPRPNPENAFIEVPEPENVQMDIKWTVIGATCNESTQRVQRQGNLIAQYQAAFIDKYEAELEQVKKDMALLRQAVDNAILKM